MARAQREIWVKRVERWRESGLTAGDYARETGINAHTLQHWSWRLKRGDRERAPKAKQSAPLSFVEVKGPVADERIEVVLGSGTVVRVSRGFDVDALRRLLSVLQGC